MAAQSKKAVSRSKSPSKSPRIAQDIDPADSLPLPTTDTYPSVYTLLPGEFNGMPISIIRHEGRAWLMAEEVVAVLADTPEEQAVVEKNLEWVRLLASLQNHWATVRFASSSLTVRVFDTTAVHCICALVDSDRASELSLWFAGQSNAGQLTIKPVAEAETPQRADYLQQLRELYHELYDIKCFIASQLKAVLVMGEGVDDEEVYPIVDLAKTGFGLTKQLDALLDRYDSLLTDFRKRLLREPSSDEAMPESVWLSLVEELSAEREALGNEDFYRLSMLATTLRAYTGNQPEAGSALRCVKSFVEQHGAYLYDHQPSGTVSWGWKRGCSPFERRQAQSATLC